MSDITDQNKRLEHAFVFIQSYIEEGQAGNALNLFKTVVKLEADKNAKDD